MGVDRVAITDIRTSSCLSWRRNANSDHCVVDDAGTESYVYGSTFTMRTITVLEHSNKCHGQKHNI